jgi:hypothetical protein
MCVLPLDMDLNSFRIDLRTMEEPQLAAKESAQRVLHQFVLVNHYQDAQQEARGLTVGKSGVA